MRLYLLFSRLRAYGTGTPACVSSQRAAELQVVLEGVPLPATKQELIAYAREQDERMATDLGALPDREYRSLDEVGEVLAPAQPSAPAPGPPLPHDESGEPPGGDAYLNPHPEPGAVRDDAPPSNPPQNVLEEQTKTQKRQQERQKQLG
jgi:hypothetical protein